jgi:FlaA1/EpsC-like NDP-sugar epimerase
MMRLPHFTPRMGLILAHDLIATAVALLASFYIRFEDAGLAARWPVLIIMLPVFVLYAGIVYTFCGLLKSKWRFTSLPDLMNIVRAATVLAVTLLAIDYVLVAPNILGNFFIGKITIALYWFLQTAFLAGSRVAYRYFRYTRTLQHAKAGETMPTLVLGPAADAEVLLREKSSRSVSYHRRAPTARRRSAASRCSANSTISSRRSTISPAAASM